MNNREWKRHQQRKARLNAAAGIEPTLKNTRMVVMPMDDGLEVRCLEIDAEEPLPVIVRWGRRAFLQSTPSQSLRTLTVSNWNGDRRELFEIPEARAYMRRLWSEAKPLLRMLSESTTAPRPDDLNGLPPGMLSLAGMGWLDVYMIGHHELERAEEPSGELGVPFKVWVQGMTDDQRDQLRAELLQVSDDNPGGVSFDAAAERTHFMSAHTDKLREMAVAVIEDGKTDHALVIASVLDDVGRKLSVLIAGDKATRENLERCRAGDLHPGTVFVAPRAAVVDLVQEFAPNAAGMMKEKLPDGEFWVVSVAAGGTQLGRFSIPHELTK